MDANWRKSYAAVSRELHLTVRASSAVECMNGVLRMHQSRHKTVTQGLLDLKRLYCYRALVANGFRIVPELLPHGQSCSQFAPTWEPPRRAQFARGKI